MTPRHLCLLLPLACFVALLPSLSRAETTQEDVSTLNLNDILRQAFDLDKAAHITKNSYFEQIFQLGFKITLICIAHGSPLPAINWYKDGGLSLQFKYALNVEERLDIPNNTIRSKLEIDPASVGDAGVYTCLANNIFNSDARSFRVLFTLGGRIVS